MELSRIDLTRFGNVGDDDDGALSMAPLDRTWPPSSINVMQNLCEVDDDDDDNDNEHEEEE
jgi:hypothetical protein